MAEDGAPLSPLLNEINKAAAGGLRFLAVAMTTALPDICVSLISGDGRSNRDRYKKWCKENLGSEFNFLTGDNLWSIRCGVLHNGRFGDLKHKGIIPLTTVWDKPIFWGKETADAPPQSKPSPSLFGSRVFRAVPDRGSLPRSSDGYSPRPPPRLREVRQGQHLPSAGGSSGLHVRALRRECAPCAGTIFQDTRTPLRMWFYAIYLFVTTRHGVRVRSYSASLG